MLYPATIGFGSHFLDRRDSPADSFWFSAAIVSPRSVFGGNLSADICDYEGLQWLF
jgi:hypothetical protein